MAFKKFNEGEGSDFTPREKVKGNWKCTECGAEITELPFDPIPGRPLYCIECWKKQRNQRFER